MRRNPAFEQHIWMHRHTWHTTRRSAVWDYGRRKIGRSHSPFVPKFASRIVSQPESAGMNRLVVGDARALAREHITISISRIRGRVQKFSSPAASAMALICSPCRTVAHALELFTFVGTLICRQFHFTERISFQARGDFFNILNHPNFGSPINYLSSPQFGQATTILNNYLGAGGQSGGLNPLYQIGGPRSIQLALKLQF